MKCKVLQSIRNPRNYGALKNFNDHMRVTITYMEFKETLRANNGHRILRDLFSKSCLCGRYLMK